MLFTVRMGIPRRIFWAYGPGRAEITVLGLEPHPEKAGYAREKLSELPPL
jgi:hypothetical protein